MTIYDGLIKMREAGMNSTYLVFVKMISSLFLIQLITKQKSRVVTHIYKNKIGRVHSSFSYLNQSIIYLHYCLSLARPNGVDNNNSARALDKLESASI